MSVDELKAHAEAILKDESVQASLEYLEKIAQSGKSPYEWTLLKVVVLRAFQNRLKEWTDRSPLPSKIGDEDASAWIVRIESGLKAFSRPPWTLQRICEILLGSQKSCRSSEAFVLAVHRVSFFQS